MEQHGGFTGAGAALHAAIQGGHTEMLRWLLERGADANSANYEGKTPLRAALDGNQSEMAELIHAKGGHE